MALQVEKGTDPLTIIEYSNSKLRVNRTGITRLLTQDRFKDAPIIVVSVIGPPSTGKTMLLNMIMNHVTEYNSDIGTRAQKMIGIMQGFPYTHKDIQATVKISIWPEPFWVKCGIKEAAILFVDSEGLFDEELSCDVAAAITAFCTLLSSTQIYNVQSYINELSLEKLVGHLKRGRIPLGREESLLSQRIVFLVRDWIGGKRFGYGDVGGKAYIKEKLECSKTVSDSELRNRQFIKDVYLTVDCYLMPHPGDKLADLEDFTKAMAPNRYPDLNPKFIAAFNNLIPYLLHPVLVEGAMSADNFFTGKTWLDSFLTYAAEFSEEKVLAVMSTHRASEEYYNYQLLKESMDEFVQQMDQNRNFDQLEMDKLLSKIRQLFEKRLKGDMAMRNRFQHVLADKMKDQIRLAIVHSEVKQASADAADRRKCDQVLNEARLRFLSRMEENKAHSDPETLREYFKKAEVEATELFDKQMHDLEAVRDPYRDDLLKFFKKKANIMEEECKLAEQAKKEFILKAEKAKHLAVKEYRLLRDQEYPIMTPKTSKEDILHAHARWLVAAHERYGRDMNTGPSENKEDISEIDEHCKRHFDNLLERFHDVKKQYNELLPGVMERIKNEVVQAYLERYRETLVPPESVVEYLFTGTMKYNVHMELLASDRKVLRDNCLFALKKVYQSYESFHKNVKEDMQKQLQLGVDAYKFDMIKKMFTDGENPEDAHKSVKTILMHETAKQTKIQQRPLIDQFEKAMEEEFKEMKILQQKKIEALAEFLLECEHQRIKPNAVLAEKIIDHTAEKWFSDLPGLPADICKRWIVRDFETLCKRQKPKVRHWYSLSR